MALRLEFVLNQGSEVAHGISPDMGLADLESDAVAKGVVVAKVKSGNLAGVPAREQVQKRSMRQQ